MTQLRVTLAAGVRLRYDGRLWEVIAVSAPDVLLKSELGEICQVGTCQLLAHPSTRLMVPGADLAPDSAGADLASLDDAQVHNLRGRVADVQEIRTGYRRGSKELALPGEPRPEYTATSPLMVRYQAKARELGISVATVRRWVQNFEDGGPAGLLGTRRKPRADPLTRVDARWLEMARVVLAEHTDASTPTQNIVLARIRSRLEQQHGPGSVPVPGETKARRILKIAAGTGAFGGAKARRSIASRPATPYGRLRATRPGEYLVFDTTPLDVFAMDPVTLRWVRAELTVALDLFDRCITGLRLTPISTKAVDAAAVLFESVRPLPEPAAGWVDIRPPFHGVPAAVLIDPAKLVDENGNLLLPSVAAETVIVDHGKIYLSEHLLSVCQRLGISVQPARVYQATDKPVERFFRTIREQLLVALPGYKGPDVYSRGKDIESQAFYFLDELEQIIRRWVADCYHRQPHDGLCIPEVPGLRVSPLEMFGYGVNRAGYLQIPARADLVYDFLRVEWRTIQHYGVEIGGLRYDGAALNLYRNRASGRTGRHTGKWPIRVDQGDVSRVYFQDPADGAWHALTWEHAAAVGGPFSSEALAYARRLAAQTHRFPDTVRALAELLESWDSGLTRNPTEQRMAIRISEQRLRLIPDHKPGSSRDPKLPFLPGTPAASDLSGDPLHASGLAAGDDDTGNEPGAPVLADREDASDPDFYTDALGNA